MSLFPLRFSLPTISSRRASKTSLHRFKKKEKIRFIGEFGCLAKAAFPPVIVRENMGHSLIYNREINTLGITS